MMKTRSVYLYLEDFLVCFQGLSIGLVRSPVWAFDSCVLDTDFNRDGKRKQVRD